jgi:hypothetical protein
VTRASARQPAAACRGTSTRPEAGARVVALATAAAVSLLLPRAALACPSCYGNAEGPMIDAARLGMYLLLGITLAVQGSFVAFFLYLRRKSRQARDRELDVEWSRLQRAHDRAWRNV